MSAVIANTRVPDSINSCSCADTGADLIAPNTPSSNNKIASDVEHILIQDDRALFVNGDLLIVCSVLMLKTQ